MIHLIHKREEQFKKIEASIHVDEPVEMGSVYIDENKLMWYPTGSDKLILATNIHPIWYEFKSPEKLACISSAYSEGESND